MNQKMINWAMENIFSLHAKHEQLREEKGIHVDFVYFCGVEFSKNRAKYSGGISLN